MKTLYILADRISIDGPYCPSDADKDLGVFETKEAAEAAWANYIKGPGEYCHGEMVIKVAKLNEFCDQGLNEIL